MSCPDCKSKVPCGCGDAGYTTGPSCAQDTPSCPNPDPCPETFSDQCIVHMGDTIFDLDIKKGDRMSDVIQKLVLAITGCNALPGAICPPPVGLVSTVITSTAITIAWNPALNATDYQVEYKETTALSWTLAPSIPAVASPVYTITGLTANTEYMVRVRTLSGVDTGVCPSVTLLIKTKTA